MKPRNFEAQVGSVWISEKSKTLLKLNKSFYICFVDFVQIVYDSKRKKKKRLNIEAKKSYFL